MEKCSDFVEWLGPDMSIKIFMYLGDPSDLVRVSVVSRSWRQFVIRNGLCKKLCLRMFPEMGRAALGVEVSNMRVHAGVGSSNPLEWELLERDYRLYAFLAKGLMSFARKDCISDAISASSTDNYPEETIQNTLVPSDRVDDRASYWSSKGESDPAVPETLTYSLISKLCVVTEVSIKPFQAFFQFGFPIYSAKAVRFRMGYPKSPMEMQNLDEFEEGQRSADDYFVWTYISPEFPMAQENCLQKFKLPEPVLCIGGILQVELLGRVQKQDMDGLFYICVCYVQVTGRPLSPAFDVEILDASGKCMLQYNPEAEYCMSPQTSDEPITLSPLHTFTTRLVQRGVRGWERIGLNRLLGNIVVANDNDSDEELIA